MKIKYPLIYLFFVLVLNLIFTVVVERLRDVLIVGLPLPFYTITLNNAPCTNGLCPSMMVEETSFYLTNLVLDIIFWTAGFLGVMFYRAKKSAKVSGSKDKK